MCAIMLLVRGPICLQGGAEFQPGCEQMDAAMLQGGRRVLVLPFAARAGHERRAAAANARAWYASLGAGRVDVVLEGLDLPAALQQAAGEQGRALVVLPGGSPARLLDALAPHEELLRSAVANGVAVSGASAGAMVLCRWTILPGGRLRVAPALGVVDVDLVVPHFRGGTSWLDAAAHALPENPVVLGLPERSGAVVAADGTFVPAGAEPFSRLAENLGR